MWGNQNFTFRPSYSMNYNPSWYSMPIRKFEKDSVKRKLAMEEMDDEFLLPPKMHISEEKMVSQLNGIHLSSDFTSHGSCGLRVEADSQMNGETLPKLTMCEEIKNMATTSTQEILPRQLLEQCRRPTNALVLWQPPKTDLGKFLGAIQENKNEELEEEEKPEEAAPRDVDMMEEDDNNNNNNGQVNSFFARTI